MSNRITSIFPSNPSDSYGTPAITPTSTATTASREEVVDSLRKLATMLRAGRPADALFAALFVAILPRLTRAKLVETLRTIAEKVVATAGQSADARFNVAITMNDLALEVAREAHLRGYITQAQVAPSQTGLGAEYDKAITDDEKIAVFVKQFNLVADLIEKSTEGSDSGVTPATLAASMRDSVATDVSLGEPIGAIVEATHGHMDRAIAEGYLTEDEIQAALDSFDDDYAGGSKYLAHMADLIETSATRNQGEVEV